MTPERLVTALTACLLYALPALGEHGESTDGDCACVVHASKIRSFEPQQWDQLPPIGLTADAHPQVPRAAQGLVPRRGQVTFEIRGAVHTGDIRDDPMLQLRVTHERDMEDLGALFAFVLARQSYVPERSSSAASNNRPVSVANLMADVLLSGDTAAKFKRALIKRATEVELPTYLRDLGMPVEGALVGQLMARVPRPDTADDQALLAAGAAWLASPHDEGELAHMAVAYHRIKDGPVNGAGRSWSLTWQVMLDQLEEDVRAKIIARHLPEGDLDPRNFSGLYEQQLLGSNYYVERLVAYERHSPGGALTAWHYSFIGDMGDGIGTAFADKPVQWIEALAEQADRSVHPDCRR